MQTLTHTINGSSVVKCYTLSRSNAEAIAQGRVVIAVHDGYLLLGLRYQSPQQLSLNIPGENL